MFYILTAIFSRGVLFGCLAGTPVRINIKPADRPALYGPFVLNSSVVVAIWCFTFLRDPTALSRLASLHLLASWSVGWRAAGPVRANLPARICLRLRGSVVIAHGHPGPGGRSLGWAIPLLAIRRLPVFAGPGRQETDLLERRFRPVFLPPIVLRSIYIFVIAMETRLGLGPARHGPRH